MSVLDDTRKEMQEENDKKVAEALALLDSLTNKRKSKDNKKKTSALAGRSKVLWLLSRFKK